MDKSLGDIVNFLKEKGIDKNTVIIFMSDNGQFGQSARAGATHTQNSPLRYRSIPDHRRFLSHYIENCRNKKL